MYQRNRLNGQVQGPSEYQLHEQIGSGQFSTVHRCTHTPTSKVYAIKCIPKYHFQQIPQLYQLLQTELRLLRQFSHPNVINLIDNNEDSRMFYIIYEYCPDGTLHSLFQKHRIGKIPSNQAIDYFKQMISALECLHKHSLLHRDIKPANILLCQNGKVAKLSDFGFCKQTNLTHTQLGTPGYMAPEMLNGRSYDQKADVYSLGICLQQLISNSERNSSLESYSEIANQMVRRDPTSRPTIQQVSSLILSKENEKKSNEMGQIKKIRSRSQPCCQRPQQQILQCQQFQQEQQLQLNNKVYLRNSPKELPPKFNYQKKATQSPQQRYNYNYNNPKQLQFIKKQNINKIQLKQIEVDNNNNKENQYYQNNIQDHQNSKDQHQQKYNIKNCDQLIKKYNPQYENNVTFKNEKKIEPLKKVQDLDYIRQKYQNKNQIKYR